MVYVQGWTGGIGAIDDDDDDILAAVRGTVVMRNEEKRVEISDMQVKKGRVLGLVVVGPLRSLGVDVAVVLFFIFFFEFFSFFPFLYISLPVGILFAVHL